MKLKFFLNSKMFVKKLDYDYDFSEKMAIDYQSRAITHLCAKPKLFFPKHSWSREIENISL